MQYKLNVDYYKSITPPVRVKGENFSVDVYTIDEDGLINIAFYNFDSLQWIFHGDTVSCPKETKFVWFYPDTDLSEIEF